METATKQKRLVDPILKEIDQEAEVTKRLFDIIPEDKLSWRPHPTARSLGELAMHIAIIQGFVAVNTQADSEELSPPPEGEAGTRAEILEAFADSLEKTKSIVGATDDERVMSELVRTKDGEIKITMPRGGVLEVGSAESLLPSSRTAFGLFAAIRCQNSLDLRTERRHEPFCLSRDYNKKSRRRSYKCRRLR